MLNLRLAVLAAAVMSVAFVALTIASAPRPEAQSSPSISVSVGSRTIDQGSSTSASVSTSNLATGRSYLVRVSTSGGIGFNSSCSDNSDLAGENGGSFTVYGCTPPSGSVSAELCDVTGGGVDPDSTDDAVARQASCTNTVDSDSASVKVRAVVEPTDTPTPTPTMSDPIPPAPAISLNLTGNSIQEGHSTLAQASASNLNVSHNYSIRFILESTHLTFQWPGCTDQADTVQVPNERTSFDAEARVWGCRINGGWVRAELFRRSGGEPNSPRSVIASDREYVTVTYAPPTPTPTPCPAEGCPTPTPPPDTPTPTPVPSVRLVNLVDEIVRGNSDSFSVEATNLNWLHVYEIQVEVETPANVGFDRDCSTSPQTTVAVPPQATEHTTPSDRLYGCRTTGSWVTAALIRKSGDVDPDSVRGSGTSIASDTSIATDREYVRVVEPPPPPPTPTPPPLPTIFVSIDLHDAVPDTVDESFIPLGADSKQVRWTLTANPRPRNKLTVKISVALADPIFEGAELGNFLIKPPPQTITIAPTDEGTAEGTADLILPMHDDFTDEAPVKIRVTVLDGRGYEPGHLSSAVVIVRDNDPLKAPTGLRANGDLQAGNISLRWTEATRAASYNVQYARCSNPSSDCSSVGEWHLLTDFTDTVVETGGLADEDKKFKANQLYRVQVQSSADDYPATPGAPNKEVSEWDDAGFVFLYPTDEILSPPGGILSSDTFVTVATVRVGRFQPRGLYSYKFCKNTVPDSLPGYATRNDVIAEIRNGIEKWQNSVLWDGSVVRAQDEVTEEDCGDIMKGVNPTVEQMRFGTSEELDRIDCGHRGTPGCWSRINEPGNLLMNQNTLQYLLFNSDSRWSDYWHKRLSGCTNLHDVAAHEGGHAYGITHGGDTRTETVYSIMRQGDNTTRCTPSEYDKVAIMANYQSR